MSASHLPPVDPNHVFVVSSSTLIDAPIEKVWSILLDFPSYPSWNTFTRSMVFVNPKGETLLDQTIELGKHIKILAHMAPGPVPSDPGYWDRGDALAVVSSLEPEIHRVAWTAAMYPSYILHTVRTQVLSVDEATGKTKYENREVFGGWLAYVVRFFVGGKLNQGFAAAAECLKKYAEKD